MDTFLLSLFIGVIPLASYVTVIVLFRKVSLKDSSFSPYLKIFRISGILLASVFIVFLLHSFFLPSNQVQVYDYTLQKIYMVSVMTLFVYLVRIHGADRIPDWLKWISVLFVSVLFSGDLLLFTEQGVSLVCFLSKMLIILLTGLFILLVYRNRGKADMKDIMNQILLLLLYNTFYLVYQLELSPQIDFLVGIYCFLVLHLLQFFFILKDRGPHPYPLSSDGSSLLMEEGKTAPLLEQTPARPIEIDFEPESKSLKNRLIGYFLLEKPYLSKDISMEEVASKLYTNKTYLSKTINEEMKKNFRELVNYFRVKEAMDIFMRDPEVSMVDLRERSGFNNNASFISAFKLNTGHTPHEWCRMMREK